MLCSRSHILMTENLKRLITSYEKKGKDTNMLQARYHDHKFQAYRLVIDGTDYEIGKAEEDYACPAPT